ncbi:MAG TPA: zf-TFIIB domain-containing protein [Tepidiformaceae bacterium]|nr:zf-TFIIB domain-containing protein [Tepidiformaceae bacterium]
MPGELRSAAGTAASPRVYSCPACEGRPALEVFRRYELITVEPLRYCPRCFGFWAAKDALSRGVHDEGSDHPAVLAGRAPARCRFCFGRLREDEVCRKCGKSLPEYLCPSCDSPMQRQRGGGITLDHCGACSGTWFDTGEVRATYGLQPAPTAMRKVYGEALDQEPESEISLILQALGIVSRIFLPF